MRECKKRRSDEQILEAIRRFYQETGEIPTTVMFEQAKLGVSCPTAQARFGTWGNAVRLAIGKTRKRRGNKKGNMLPCLQCGKLAYKRPADLRKSSKSFCSKSCATIYKNIHNPGTSNRSKVEMYLDAKLREKYPSLIILFNDRLAIGLELDIFIPSLRLAVELNGNIHYEPIFGKDKFEKVKKRDQQKMIECYKKDIELAVVNTCHRYFTEKIGSKFFDIVTEIIDPILSRQNHAYKPA